MTREQIREAFIRVVAMGLPSNRFVRALVLELPVGHGSSHRAYVIRLVTAAMKTGYENGVSDPSAMADAVADCLLDLAAQS